MGFLDRLFGKKQEAPIAIEGEPAEECPHGALAPHWDNVADFGKSDLIAFYICEACKTKLDREEGAAAMKRASETVRVDLSVRKQVQDAADEAQSEERVE
jgi:hypothetical protein